MDNILMTNAAKNIILSNEQLCSETVNRSWFEEVEEFEQQNMAQSVSMTSESNTSNTDTNEALVKVEQTTIPMCSDKNATSIEDEYLLSGEQMQSGDDKDMSGDREIFVKFLDSSNEEKYERLVKEEKIKTPLKRRLSSSSPHLSSNSSRSSSPYADERDTVQTSNTERVSEKFYFAKRTRVDSEGKFVGQDRKSACNKREYETDEGVLARRQKQIDYGKNTVGYDRYTKEVPREKRTSEHPWTPPKNLKYSRRAFDGLIKVWRKKLHCYDSASMGHCDGQIEASSSDED